MFIGTTRQRERKLSVNVNGVEKHSMITHATPRGVNIVPMSARIASMLRKKTGFVNIAEWFLLSTHHLLLNVVRGYVVSQGQKLRHGLPERKPWNNVRSVEKNFGLDRIEKHWEKESFVLVNARLIPKNLMLLLHLSFMGLDRGFKFVKGFLQGTTRPANNVVFREHIFMSTIKNLNEMVGWRGMKILQPYVRIAT